MHSFIFGSSTFGGHEMMAAKIIGEVMDSVGPVLLIAPPAQIQRLRERLPPGVTYVPLQHQERRFESLSGYLNPRLHGVSKELRTAIRGTASLTLVNGGLTANHTLTLAAAQAARHERVPARVYYPMLHDTRELSLGSFRSISYRAAQRRVASAFDHFITIDELWRDRLLARAGRPLDVQVIHNLLDIEVTSRVVPPEPGEPVRLCFVGRFDRYQKGLDLLIDTLRLLRERSGLAPMQWVFVGNGPDEAILREACSALGTGNMTFEFHGWQRSAIELMGRCHALVMPSRLEGVPTVVAEALTLGLSVFAYAIKGADLMLPRDKLITPFDTAAMADAIAQFAAEAATRLALPMASTYLDMLCDRSRFRDEVIAVYRACVSPGARRS